MVLQGMSTWPDCFSQNFCWVKLEIRLSACFPIFNEIQTVCRVWELPKQRGWMSVTSQHPFRHTRVSWHNRVFRFVWISPSCLLPLCWSRGRETRAGPRLGQTNKVYWKFPDSCFPRSEAVSVLNSLSPTYFEIFLLLLLLLQKELWSVLAANWLKVLTSLNFGVRPIWI